MRRALPAGLAALALAAPGAASAQLLLSDPAFAGGPIEGSDPLVGLPLRGATPAEYRAHLIWNLRSGLNVAALQCQFSPYLRTVDIYNAILAHHSRELASAYTALGGYFRRTAGRNSGRQFDQYSTQTYNNFASLQAQYAFCQTAARIARETLAAPKGQLATVAGARMRELRASLVPREDPYAFARTPIGLTPLAIGTVRRDCSQLPRRERRECERER